MNPNLASTMPQAVGVWCQEAGHHVRFICYTGFEDFNQELLDDTDILFVGAFTRAALSAYAISNLYRHRGAVTVLGAPMHAATPKTRRGISTMPSALLTNKSSRRCCAIAPRTGLSSDSSARPCSLCSSRESKSAGSSSSQPSPRPRPSRSCP